MTLNYSSLLYDICRYLSLLGQQLLTVLQNNLTTFSNITYELITTFNYHNN